MRLVPWDVTVSVQAKFQGRYEPTVTTTLGMRTEDPCCQLTRIVEPSAVSLPGSCQAAKPRLELTEHHWRQERRQTRSACELTWRLVLD